MCVNPLNRTRRRDKCSIPRVVNGDGIKRMTRTIKEQNYGTFRNTVKKPVADIVSTLILEISYEPVSGFLLRASLDLG